jgi:hypothetical protein
MQKIRLSNSSTDHVSPFYQSITFHLSFAIILCINRKAKAVPLYTTEALGGEEVV